MLPEEDILIETEELQKREDKRRKRRTGKKVAKRIIDASRGHDRGGGSLGDTSICAFIPYDGTVDLMQQDKDFKRNVVSELKRMYREIRNRLYRMIGSPSYKAMDPVGIVPIDTGTLRRSLRWSLSRKYAIVPENGTAPEEVALYMWLFAKPDYAQAVTQMDRVKGRRHGPPAVQHPTRFPQLNWSRQRGGPKFDPAADPNFYQMLVAEGKRLARRLYFGSPIINTYFHLELRNDIRS